MQSYHYAIGRIRALEVRLLSSSQIMRMEAAPNFESAFNLLSETAYAEHLGSLKHPFDFEELCELEMEAVKALMRQLAPEALKLARRASHSPLVKSLINAKSDLFNLRSLLRFQALGREKASFAAFLRETGLIDRETLLSLYDKKAREMIPRLNHTPYFPGLAEGFEQYANNGSFTLLEKQMDDLILKGFHRAKYLAAGIEPLIGYYLAKESEVKTIRFILVAKKCRLHTERIKERIRTGW